MVMELQVRFAESDTKGRYSIKVDGLSAEAELTISKATQHLVVADHTFVPEVLRGQGAAKTMAKRLVADARSKDQRIVPLCPFIRAYAEKRREALSDVIQW